MSVRRNVRLNPYMIQEKNAAEANIVTSIFVTTNSLSPLRPGSCPQSGVLTRSLKDAGLEGKCHRRLLWVVEFG